MTGASGAGRGPHGICGRGAHQGGYKVRTWWWCSPICRRPVYIHSMNQANNAVDDGFSFPPEHDSQMEDIISMAFIIGPVL